MSLPHLLCRRLSLSRLPHLSAALTNRTRPIAPSRTASVTRSPYMQCGYYSNSATDRGETAATGFSHPGARKLSDIVKLQLLNKHGAGRVREIWNEYHKGHKSAVGDVLTAEEYGLLRQRSERCRHFVLPVYR